MAKRNKPAKRRDRASGLSPWVRHNKVKTTYSPQYQSWKAENDQRTAYKRAA